MKRRALDDATPLDLFEDCGADEEAKKHSFLSLLLILLDS